MNDNQIIKNKAYLFIIILIASIFLSNPVFSNSEISLNQNLDVSSFEKIEIDYFYSLTCSACAHMTPLLEDISDKYDFVILNKYNTADSGVSNIFLNKLEEYNVPRNERGFVPTTFIKDSFFVGTSNLTLNEIEKIIINFGKNLENGLKDIDLIDLDEDEFTFYNTKILGIWDTQFSLDNKSLFFTTIMLGFFDSLNVCSITVLIFLIVYLLSIGSLKKSFKIGLTYTIVIFLFYFLFMILLTSILSSLVLQYGFYIRIIVFGISALVGLILIKDFFFYGKGISLSVPKSVKPVLEKQLKKATLISTIIFALLASVVELPCTAVFPLIYSTILAETAVAGLEKVLWIFLYNLIYILPLLVIVFGTYFSWISITDVDNKIQKNKKWLKLIAGIILILIALYFGSPFLF